MSGIITSGESKAIGWDEKLYNFPKSEDIDTIIKEENRLAALRVYRFAPSPDTKEKREALNRLIAFLKKTYPE